MTFDCLADNYVGEAYGWQSCHEVYSLCRNCSRGTVFVLKLSASPLKGKFTDTNSLIKIEHLNKFFRISDYITLKDKDLPLPPEYLPEEVEIAFCEGLKCLAVNCYNASATMFRLALDLATEPLLPDGNGENSPSKFQRRNLGARLGWLFDRGSLPASLKELAECVREDGNDGAHRGLLSEVDAQDLEDFSRALFERIFTEPERIRQAQIRRTDRRTAPPMAKP